MEKDAKKLGKGLGALLGGGDLPIASNSVARIKQDSVGKIRIDSIEVNPNQPRTKFDEEALRELAESIKTYGLIQPITVRPIANGRYQLISGERRLRACKLAGLQEVPTYVRTVDEMQSIQMALVENIQREDLNALEIALSYQRLVDEFGFSQEEVSDKVGKNRTTVTNYLRLLKLSLPAQIAVRDNVISMGHARALVTLENEKLQEKVLKQVIDNGLSVRQTESLVKKYSSEFKPAKTKIKITLSDEVNQFVSSISKKLNSKVSVNKDLSGKGKIVIPFTSDEDLKQMISKLM
ncbi:MAG: ParB/RepB/Spo0J family partition protein [Bacteroidales bacterium]|jgi:ParB family chromosome partitioning protein|nr:ParB/RepB/Spo0J family partition protein [Bacteroidales bacterium]